MNSSFDVIVIGLGAMGSATAYHLAKRGARVLGLDRFVPPHAWGSSHGESRIIREAYFEHPLYVPLVQRAYELWHELAQETSESLFLQTGGLMIGPPEGELVRGALLSARTHDLPHELLEAGAIRHRFPMFQISAETVAVWEPRAGILFPEKCIAAHLQGARNHGAQLHFAETVLSWRERAGHCVILTTRGEYEAARLVFTAGAWLADLFPDLRLPLLCTRQVLFWFAAGARKENFAPSCLPIFLCEHQAGRCFYGFPDLGHGVKAAIHHEGELASPETLRREVGEDEALELCAVLAQYLPGLAAAPRQTAVCMYTNTPDGHFLIDFHPASSQILLVSPCSSHGFKFSCAIGEAIAQLFGEGRAHVELSPFSLQRFARQGGGIE